MQAYLGLPLGQPSRVLFSTVPVPSIAIIILIAEFTSVASWGACSASYRGCNILNSVNMANVTFNGKPDYYLYIGGIVGGSSQP